MAFIECRAQYKIGPSNKLSTSGFSILLLLSYRAFVVFFLILYICSMLSSTNCTTQQWNISNSQHSCISMEKMAGSLYYSSFVFGFSFVKCNCFLVIRNIARLSTTFATLFHPFSRIYHFRESRILLFCFYFSLSVLGLATLNHQTQNVELNICIFWPTFSVYSLILFILEFNLINWRTNKIGMTAEKVLTPPLYTQLNVVR